MLCCGRAGQLGCGGCLLYMCGCEMGAGIQRAVISGFAGCTGLGVASVGYALRDG